MSSPGGFKKRPATGTVGVALIFPWGATFSAGHSRAPTLNMGTQMAAIERSHYELEPSTPPLLIRGLPELIMRVEVRTAGTMPRQVKTC